MPEESLWSIITKGLRRNVRQFFSKDVSIENPQEYQLGATRHVDSYIKKRFHDSLMYYKMRANHYKLLYIILQASIIIFGSLIPILNAIIPGETGIKILISSILGALVGIFSGILQLFKAHDFWMMYASSIDEMETEYERFIHSLAIYSSDPKYPQDKPGLFMERIEEIIITNRKQYVFSRRSSPTVQDSSQNQKGP